MIIDILFPTTPTVGDNFTMTCNISIPGRLVHDLTRIPVIWSYDQFRLQKVDSDATIENATGAVNLILSTLTLHPVKTSDDRRYYCSVIFNDLGVDDHVFRDLNVQSKLFNIKLTIVIIIISQSLLPVWLSDGVLPVVLSMRVLTST